MGVPHGKEGHSLEFPRGREGRIGPLNINDSAIFPMKLNKDNTRKYFADVHSITQSNIIKEEYTKGKRKEDSVIVTYMDSHSSVRQLCVPFLYQTKAPPHRLKRKRESENILLKRIVSGCVILGT